MVCLFGRYLYGASDEHYSHGMERLEGSLYISYRRYVPFGYYSHIEYDTLHGEFL